LLITTSSDTSVVKRTYDAEGNIATLTNGRGASWSFQYDARNQLEVGADAEAPPRTTSYTYDAVGNLKTKTDPKGQTTSWTYDALNRWTSKVFSGGHESITYDETGHITRVADSATEVTRTYDALDRLVSYSAPAANRTVVFSYDRAGLRKSIQLGTDLQSYEHDQNGRLRSITLPSGDATVFHYDVLGNIVRKDLPNGVRLDQTWDGISRLVGMQYSHSLAGSLETLSFTLDPNGNVLSETSSSGTASFTYTAQDQLKSATYSDGVVEQFEYDAAGNRTKRILASSDGSQYSPVTHYSYSATNQIEVEDVALRYWGPPIHCNGQPNCGPPPDVTLEYRQFQHDGNGNLVSVTPVAKQRALRTTGKIN
jgi:YD repeat-containing protein